MNIKLSPEELEAIRTGSVDTVYSILTTDASVVVRFHRSIDFLSALSEMGEYLRQLQKYGGAEKFATGSDAVDAVRLRYFEILEACNINLDEMLG